VGVVIICTSLITVLEFGSVERIIVRTEVHGFDSDERQCWVPYRISWWYEN